MLGLMDRMGFHGELEGTNDPLGSRSLSVALRQEVEKLILKGDFSAGERLNEGYFAEKFNVSRGPVREAFRLLVEAGLLEFIPHRGVFVRQISFDQAVATYEVRAGLFGLAGRLAAERIDNAEIGRLCELVRRMDECMGRSDGQGYYRINLELHARILEATRNERLVRTCQGLNKELHLFRAINLEGHDHMNSSNAEHGKMVEALRARDGRLAFEVHYQHVMNARERVLESVSSNPGGGRQDKRY